MKTHYSCAELAAMQLPGLPTTKMGWANTVKTGGWEGRKRTGRGGGIEYTPPPRIAKLIAARHAIKEDGLAAAAARAAMAAVKIEARTKQHARAQVQVEYLMASLSVTGQQKLGASFDIVLAYRDYFKAHNSNGQIMRRKESFKAFSDDYNAKRIKVSDEVRAKYTTISMSSIQRWVLNNEKRGLVALVDHRATRGGTGGNHSIIEQHPELEKALIAIIAEKPHIKTTHLLDVINAFSVDKETGVIAWPTVSYWALNRWRGAFESRDKQALMAITNPDAWKNNYLSALGRLDEDVLYLNQRWEMDGTPADWELIDGRHTASVVLDIWGRRPKILFSKTPRTETNKLLLRSAIMDWGMLDGQADTDNGSDYKSREMRMFFDEIGVEQRFCTPFSPWQKGHVERFIKTYLHSILELLDNFIGHNVAERKQIEAKRTFAENLFKKNSVVKVDMTAAELQRLTDQWIDGVYMVREHRSLGMSPLEKVASYTGSIRQITNERALDILLAKPAGKMPTITKKGIRYDNATYIHAELPQYIGELADIRHSEDLGKLIVYVNGKFLCIAECPERTGMDRAEVAAHGRAKQKEFIAAKRKEYRAAKHALPMSTGDLVKEILMSRAEKAGKVTVLAKRAEEYRTSALAEAERVIQAQEAPQLSPEHAKLMAEARRLLNTQGAQVEPIAEVHPIEMMTFEQKVELWYRQRDLLAAGGMISDPRLVTFQRQFEHLTRFKALRQQRQEESPSEQQL